MSKDNLTLPVKNTDAIILGTLPSKLEVVRGQNNASDASLAAVQDKERDISFITPNIEAADVHRSRSYFKKPQNWIGFVTQISSDGFSARLNDKTNSSTSEEAEFDLEDVSNGDSKLLKIGAVFYWSVGYANQNGQIIKQSILRFKRDANMSDTEFDFLADRASELNNNILWD